MVLTLYLSATLRRFVPQYDPQQGVEIDAKDMTVGEICQLLNIPLDQVKIVMVNGRHGSLSHPLNGDERVALFPPVGGG